MTTEELKAHRLTICKALIEGKQCQYHSLQEDIWVEHCRVNIARALFASEEGAHLVRIKPEPRKVWLGWPANPKHVVPYIVENENGKCLYDSTVKWQLVEEPE